MTEAAHDLNETFQMKIATLEKVVEQLMEENERITAVASGFQEGLQSTTVDLARTIGHLAERLGGQAGRHVEIQADVEELERQNEVLRQRLTTKRDELRMIEEFAAHGEQTYMHRVVVHSRFAVFASDGSEDSGCD